MVRNYRRVMQAKNKYSLTDYFLDKEKCTQDVYLSSPPQYWVILNEDLASELCCQRVLADEKDKAESEMHRTIAMEKLSVHLFRLNLWRLYCCRRRCDYAFTRSAPCSIYPEIRGRKASGGNDSRHDKSSVLGF